MQLWHKKLEQLLILYKQILHAWHMKQQQHPADHLFVVSRVAHVVFTALNKTINWISLVPFILARGDLGSIFLIGSTFVLISASFKVDVISFRILCEWNITFYAHIVSKFTIFLYCLVEALLPWRARKAFVTLFWSETWRPKKTTNQESETKMFFPLAERLCTKTRFETEATATQNDLLYSCTDLKLYGN